MRRFLRFLFVPLLGVACAGIVFLAGCADKPDLPPDDTSSKPPGVSCTPTSAGDPMIGIWYAVSRPKGVAGDLHTLMTLAADGSMRYETQLKINGRIRPALRESGCWTVADGIYVMQTTVSNGEDVDTSDPIYVNRYRVEKIDGARLILRDFKGGGQALTARRMPPGYHLPF